MKFDGTLFGQYLSCIMGFISTFLNYKVIKSDRELKLRKQKQDDEKRHLVLITNFLDSITAFSSNKTSENKENVRKRSIELIAELNKNGDDIGNIKGLANCIKEYNPDQANKTEEEKIERQIKSTITKLLNSEKPTF